jgi:hypothetical protein
MMEGANLVLLLCCAAALIVALVSTLTTILVMRKNSSLVELLRVESKENTQNILLMNDRFNSQLYNFQEQTRLEHVASLRQLLESFSIAASGKPDA